MIVGVRYGTYPAYAQIVSGYVSTVYSTIQYHSTYLPAYLHYPMDELHERGWALSVGGKRERAYRTGLAGGCDRLVSLARVVWPRL